MKWLSKKLPEPKLDDRRRRAVFAWWPRRCDDGMTHWLERIKRVDVYRRGGSKFGVIVVGWHFSHYEAPVGIYFRFSGPSFAPKIQWPPPYPPPPPPSADPGKK